MQDQRASLSGGFEKQKLQLSSLQTVSWISLTAASVVLALATVWAGEKYWTYTTDDYTHILKLANEKNAATLSELRRTRDQILRLTHPNRHPKPPASPGGNLTPGESNATMEGKPDHP